VSRILFDAFDSATPVVPPSGPDGILLGTGLEFDAGARHVVQYWTDVHKSWSGLERRTALLGKPRESLALTATIIDETVFRELRRRRVFDPTALFLIPVRHEAAAVSGDVTGTSFVVDGTYLDWLVPGQRVYIEGSTSGYAAVIQTAGAGPGATVTVDIAPPSGVFPGTCTVVMPIRHFYLEPANPVTRYNVGAGQWAVTARAKFPMTTIGTGAVVNTFDGLPVLDVQPIIVGLGAEDRPDGGVEVFDYDGAISLEWSRDVADIFRGHAYVITGHADRQYHRKFLETVVGRQKPFLLPTWRDDFAVASQAGANITLDDGFAYASDWFPSLAHRRLRLELVNGSVIYRRVLSISGTTQSILTTDSSIPATISRLMLLETVRLANDTVEFEFEAGVKGALELRFLVVQQ